MLLGHLEDEVVGSGIWLSLGERYQEVQELRAASRNWPEMGRFSRTPSSHCWLRTHRLLEKIPSNFVGSCCISVYIIP